MIIWWLFGDYLISNNHQIIQIIDILFDDYLSYLMIIWLIIWLIIWWLFVIICLSPWLFDDYLIDYLMIICSESLIIWWLFDDYLMIILIFWWLFAFLFRLISVLIPQPLPSRYHAGPAYIVGPMWATNYRQLEGKLKPGCDGEADTESSTGLCFGACPCSGFAAAVRRFISSSSIAGTIATVVRKRPRRSLFISL